MGLRPAALLLVLLIFLGPGCAQSPTPVDSPPAPTAEDRAALSTYLDALRPYHKTARRLMRETFRLVPTVNKALNGQLNLPQREELGYKLDALMSEWDDASSVLDAISPPHAGWEAYPPSGDGWYESSNPDQAHKRLVRSADRWSSTMMEVIWDVIMSPKKKPRYDLTSVTGRSIRAVSLYYQWWRDMDRAAEGAGLAMPYQPLTNQYLECHWNRGVFSVAHW